MPEVKSFERLPKSVVPKHYALALTLNLKGFTFFGLVDIDIQVITETDIIVLNSLDLKFVADRAVTLSNANVRHFTPDKTIVSAENETVTFQFPCTISPGNYKLRMKYTGEINDKLKGLYRSKYTSPSGEERYAAVTQFTAIDARRVFPCWDEPAIKSTFDISLFVPPELEALSNMPVKSINPLNKLIRYDFETTPVMSTYLVAAVVGEFDFVQDTSADGVLVRVYTPCGKTDQGLFALEVATKVLPYYKDYFNIAYPLPKIDLIAIADFCAGAMENWGLVTCRETCLLVDPWNTSTARKQYIALIVGHELAHQWFGNLVTMEWWTHLWLNEGYASFVQYLCVQHLYPLYDIWTQFVTDKHILALELDCLSNSHPIEVPIGHPSEINEIFDNISYNKGASIIRMLYNYIGDAAFRRGMHLYLSQHQYKNTSTEDLWIALEEASSKPVGSVMSTWTKKMGYPIVKVERAHNDDGKSVMLTITQSKFVCDGSQPDADLWMIPISVSTSKNPTAVATSIVLNSKTTVLEIPDVGPQDWIKINPGTIGFYRTQYSSDMLNSLISAIRDKSLPPLDRLGLLDDLFAIVQVGHVSTVEVLKLIQVFENEDNYSVWCIICNCLRKLNLLMSYIDSEDAFKIYERKLLFNIFNRLGWDPRLSDTHQDTLLRGLILDRLVWLDDDSIIQEAQKRFEQHIGTGQSILTDFRSACYKAVLRAGDKNTYDQMLKLYRSTDLQEEKIRISQALGAIRDQEILSAVLKFAMSEEVRSQDTVSVIASVAMTPTGRELAWQFFKDNWSELMNRYQGPFLLPRLIKCIIENFAHEDKAVEVERFFKEHKLSGTERTVQQSLESIRRNAAWLARDAVQKKNILLNMK